MNMSETFLPEFDHEMANTRKMLERVPEDKFDWRPHEKSWTMRELATHIANLPSWTQHSIKEDSIDIAPKDGEPPKVEEANSRQEILERFDNNLKDAREALAGASDERLMGAWTLYSGGKKIFSMPRVAVLRNFVLNHTIHHRAQLGIYLRLNDIPLPSIYGPSADEGEM